MNANKTTVDVLLILEGTFPYIKGGVSEWVWHLLKAYPEYSFGIAFLAGNEKDLPKKPAYSLTDNVTFFECYFLFDSPQEPKTCRANHAGKLEEISQTHQQLKAGDCPVLLDKLANIDFYHDADNGFSLSAFLASQTSWQYLCQQYNIDHADSSFVEYFWTVRNVHLPLWRLADIARRVPQCRMIHSVCTGYAGVLAAFVKQQQRVPFLLSEHGIYTKERRIEILQSTWFKESEHLLTSQPQKIQYLKNIWIHFFETCARMSYHHATTIVSLYKACQDFQIADGALPEKTRVVPNGIAISQFYIPPEKKKMAAKPVIAFIGRIVSIKDVKNLIRAMAILKAVHNNFECWLVGPVDEDEQYYQECQDLLTAYQLEDDVYFKGVVKTADILPQVDLLCLTSISEGLPLVILEAFAAAVPVVATDVGACRQLIEGELDEQDKAIGHAGVIVTISNPEVFADAILSLLTDQEKYQAMQRSASKRVQQYYNDELMIENYRQLYQSCLNTVVSEPKQEQQQWQG